MTIILMYHAIRHILYFYHLKYLAVIKNLVLPELIVNYNYIFDLKLVKFHNNSQGYLSYYLSCISLFTCKIAVTGGRNFCYSTVAMLLLKLTGLRSQAVGK